MSDTSLRITQNVMGVSEETDTVVKSARRTGNDPKYRVYKCNYGFPMDDAGTIVGQTPVTAVPIE